LPITCDSEKAHSRGPPEARARAGGLSLHILWQSYAAQQRRSRYSACVPTGRQPRVIRRRAAAPPHEVARGAPLRLTAQQQPRPALALLPRVGHRARSRRVVGPRMQGPGIEGLGRCTAAPPPSSIRRGSACRQHHLEPIFHPARVQLPSRLAPLLQRPDRGGAADRTLPGTSRPAGCRESVVPCRRGGARREGLDLSPSFRASARRRCVDTGAVRR
jgi:hypothetical protein